jgi:hypothetical protein
MIHNLPITTRDKTGCSACLYLARSSRCKGKKDVTKYFILVKLSKESFYLRWYLWRVRIVDPLIVTGKHVLFAKSMNLHVGCNRICIYLSLFEVIGRKGNPWEFFEKSENRTEQLSFLPYQFCTIAKLKSQ